MTNIAPCPNPWCSSHRRDALGSKPFIFPNDSDGGPVRVSCPVCPMEGPMEDSVAEAIEAWNHRVSPSQVAPANPAQVTELHGPFGWLNGHRALSEDSWTLESDPLENSEEYFAIPLYALTDPFKEIGKDFDGTLSVDKPHIPQELVAKRLSRLRAGTQEGWRSQATDDVLAERRRQVEAEGWTPTHDDTHRSAEMAIAGACYALNAADDSDGPELRLTGAEIWPWADEWWKPSDPRRDLVKAGALILAEIERLDRAASPSVSDGGERG